MTEQQTDTFIYSFRDQITKLQSQQSVINSSLNQLQAAINSLTGSTTQVTTNTGNSGVAGYSNLPLHSVLINDATVRAASPGTAGQVLTSNGATSDPTFQAASSGVGGGSATLISGTKNITSPFTTVISVVGLWIGTGITEILQVNFSGGVWTFSSSNSGSGLSFYYVFVGHN